MNVRTLMMYLSRLPQDADVKVTFINGEGETFNIGTIEDIEHEAPEFVTIIAVD